MKGDVLMEVFVNRDGTIIQNERCRMFRGSHLIHKIKMFGDFPDDANVSIRFMLPDGGLLEDHMTKTKQSEWELELSDIYTKIEGKVAVSFAITYDDKRLTTAPFFLYIEDSVLEE